MAKRRAKQLEMTFPSSWGGKRARAGRKRIKPGRPCMPHRTRAGHRNAHPVHVTMRVRAGLGTLRDAEILGDVREAIRKASHSPRVGKTFRVVQFSIQSDHLHLIVEASDKDRLSRGMRGLAVRLALAMQRAFGVRGQIFGDRYHARDLKTPRAVRNALVYVLMNARKHGARIANGVDVFSSAAWFGGFAFHRPSTEASPVIAAATWLGAIGWRRRGLIQLDDRPRAPS